MTGWPWRVALAFIACLVATSTANAQGTDKEPVAVAADYRDGVRRFDLKDYRGALTAFERAHAVAQSYKVLYNIGLCQLMLGHAPEALSSFDAYLAEGGSDVPPERRSRLEEQIEKLEPRVATWFLDAEAGSQLSVDGMVIGTAPLKLPLRLRPGSHLVVARFADGARTQRTLQAVAGDRSDVRLLDEDAPPLAAPTSAPARPESAATTPPVVALPRPADPLPWVAWGVTGGLVLAAGITGSVALVARGEELDTQGRYGVRQDELESSRSKVQKWALATDVLLAAAAIAAGTSLYLSLSRPSASGPRASTTLVLAPGAIYFRHEL